MTIQSDTISDQPIPAQAAAPAALAATRPLYWSVRRELWENRSLFIAPLVAAGVVIFAAVLGLVRLSHQIGTVLALGVSERSPALAIPYGIAAAALVSTSVIVAVFYCLAALHSERRDRSILFWKSLPVSDLTTVLSKALIPLAVLPLITFAVLVVVHVIMLLLGSVAMLLDGLNVAMLWTEIPVFRMELELFYGLVVIALWYAPIYGWLLLISGWARRAPFLWAVLPPLAICVIEKIAFDTSYFSSMLNYRFSGGLTLAFDNLPKGHAQIDYLPTMDPIGLLATPGLWVGLVFAAVCVATAVWLRRYRAPI